MMACGSQTGDSLVSADPYLRQVAPVLQTCWKTLYDIADLKLLVKLRPVEWHIIIKVSVTFVTVEQESRRNRRQLSGSQPTSSREVLSLIALGSVFGQKLRNAVAQELQAALELQSKESNTTRLVTKFTQLKTSLEELKQIVDRIMEYYTAQNLDVSFHLPSLEELKAVKEKICRMKSQLKVGELHKLFFNHKHELQTTEEDIMCDILGMGDNFARFLQALDVDARNHQCDFYFLERFIENTENELQAECCNNQTLGHEGLIENLQKLGFTRQRAQTISEAIPDDLIDLQIPSFWAMRYFDYIFSYHPLFSSRPRYPCNDQVVDEFFKYPVTLDWRPEPEDSLASLEKFWEVDMINVSNGEKSKKIIEEFLQMQTQQRDEKDSELFFHGTTHVHASSILQSGLKLGEGKHGQDFSSGDGFSVSEVFGNAKNWGKAGRGDHHAVVVFKVPKTLFEEENGLDLNSDEQKWTDVIGLCRREYDNGKMRRKLLKGISFVRGPKCVNPREVRAGKPPAGFDGKEDAANMQLCIRDEEYGDRFGCIENICCVIFY